MSDPRRLVDDTHTASLGRDLLERAAASGPTRAELDAAWSSIAARLPPPGGGGGEGARSATGGGRAVATGTVSSAKMALVLGGLGVATALTLGAATPLLSSRHVALRTAEPVLAAARDPLPVPVEATQRVDLAGAPPPAAESEHTPAPALASSPVRIALPRRDRAPQGRAAAVPDNGLAAESSLVLSARESMRAGDCEGAVSRLEGGKGRFAAGALAEEREALAVQALACAGRLDEARHRGEAFLREHPTSLHADLVRRVVR